MSDKKSQRAVESQIDENLRRIFEQDVDQELPDRLQSLLTQLDEDDEGQTGGGSDAGGEASGGGGSQSSGRSAHAGSGTPVPAGRAAGAFRIAASPAPSAAR